MAREIFIDIPECIGCESCVEVCPDIFEFDEDEEKARLINPEVEDEECAQESIDTCPVECIHWADEE